VDNWVRNAVVLLVDAVWAIVVLVGLSRGVVPDAIVWGVPGGIWFVMNPVFPKRKAAETTPKEPNTGEVRS
jgi:hypothetical protein